MQTVKIESNQIILPGEVVEKFMGKEIKFIEIRDGFVMKPVSDPIRKARGFLKNKRFSTERYFQMKQEEKGLEK